MTRMSFPSGSGSGLNADLLDGLDSTAFQLAPLYKALAADTAATDGNSAQNWFATAGGVTVEIANYYLEALLVWGGTGAATTHTTATSLAGTATFTNLLMNTMGSGKTMNTTATATNSGMGITNAATSFITSATNTLEGGFIIIHGTLLVSGVGTVIPQFTFSAAPANTPVVRAGTYFKLSKIVNPTGTWA